jgi:excisionase family DNA binding protein
MRQAAPKSQEGSAMEWLDLRALTRYAAVSERTIREWVHRGDNPLPAVRVGTKILVRRCIFDVWLEKHPLVPADSINVNDTVNQILEDLAIAR